MEQLNVRRTRLRMVFPHLRKLLMAMGEEYPILEYLIVGPLTQEKPILKLRNMFRAPHLRRVLLIGGFQVTSPMGFWLLTTAMGLVVLCPPVHLRPAKSPAPMAFIHASAGIAPDRDSTRYSQS